MKPADPSSPLPNGTLYTASDVKYLRGILNKAVVRTTFVNVWLQQKFRSRTLDIFCEAVSTTVSELFMTLVVPLSAVTIGSSFACHLVILFFVNLYFSNVLKTIFKLPRPSPKTPGLHTRVEVGYGFPSTHASSAIVLPICALYFFPMMRTPLMVFLLCMWASSVIFARLYLAVHSLPDVIGGIILGIFYGMLYFSPLLSRENPCLMDFIDRLCEKPHLLPWVFLATFLLVKYHPRANKEDNDESLEESVTVCILILAHAHFLC